MFRSQDALDTQFDEAKLRKLSPRRLKALKTACYRFTGMFYCDCCREFHLEGGDREKMYKQLRKNLDLISKVQNT